MVEQYVLGWSAPAVICLVVGLALMVYEMFTPGMGVPGLLGALALLAAVILRADTLTNALITLVLIVVPLMIAGGIILRSFSKGVLSRSKIVLHDAITEKSTSLGEKEMQSLVGKEGMCITALHPAGNVDFEGRRLDVVSEGGFVGKGSLVRIMRIDGVKIIVREI